MIQPIVEGEGEEQAVPILLRRLLHEALQIHDVGVRRPILQNRSDLPSEGKFRRIIQVARGKEGASGILVVFDLDRDCARDLVPNLLAWGQQEATPLPLAVALARPHYEAWFLAALPSLAGKGRIRENAVQPANPEAVRGAKAHIRSFTPKRAPYTPVPDQASLTQQFDLGQAYRGASSFRKLVKELCRLLEGLGRHPQIPADWISP